jgi:nucleotide-binding universal stress UspA family protein
MAAMKKILVAIKDLDAASLPAVRKAAQIAMATGATLELYHALSESILVDALDARRISLKDYEQGQVEAALKRLETIAKRMRMSHVYQPLMLKELLGHGFARQQPAPPPRRTWPAGSWGRT